MPDIKSVSQKALGAALEAASKAILDCREVGDDENTILQRELQKTFGIMEVCAPGSIEDIPIDPNSPRILRLQDILGEWNSKAAALHDALVNSRPLGPLSGFPKVDRELCGAFPPGVHIIHGDPGAGKTAFALQIACSCKCPALYVSCEMGPLELLRRITARVTNTYLGRFKTGELPPEKAANLVGQAIAATPNLIILDATQKIATASLIMRAAREIKRQTEAEHLLIVIDSVHSWADSMPVDNEYEALNAALASLRKMGSELGCPVIGIAERNRASQRIGGQAGSAGSRKFEYGAETVMELGRKESETNALGECEIVLTFSKNRHGSPGKTVNLTFKGALQSFEEV